MKTGSEIGLCDYSLALFNQYLPRWSLAQPFRYLAHNGEINTIRGNINKMKSKEALMESTLFIPEEIDRLTPICDSARSDSANLMR
ncbi:MAG: hypothetical protein R3B47_20380 [Bacteroidia bacterium]